MKSKILTLLLISTIVIGAGTIYFYKFIHTQYEKYLKEIAASYEAMLTFSKVQNNDTTEHHVLCIGNSLAYHKPTNMWKSSWGMAASCKDSDYCHQLEQKLKNLNKKSTVTPIYFAEWEQNSSCNVDSILGNNIKGKDIIVIQLGENVRNVEFYHIALSRLVEKCQLHTNKIILTGCFWRRPDVERQIIRVAREMDLRYVPLLWIGINYKEEIYPSNKDYFISDSGERYTINYKTILRHPNDNGMKKIAECIFYSIN